MDYQITTELQQSARLLIAALLGGLIGFQRENIGKEAGIRTHAAVCLGSCSFSLIAQNIQIGDPTRIISNIVVGIGFLGAGVIFHGKEKTTGLTTAATLWAISSVGIAIALGYFIIGIVTTLIIYLLLVSNRFKILFKHKRNETSLPEKENTE